MNSLHQFHIPEETLYQALLERKPEYEGMFVVGVKTTGVFCRPTCRARKPKRENVQFFRSSKEALLHGYRPCKICQPMAPAGTEDEPMGKLIEWLQSHPERKITDSDLARRGYKPNAVRRWFKKRHGLTFHSYQRLMRIGNAYRLLHDAGSVTSAAFESGYDSLSGFNHSFKKATGLTPTESKTRTIIFVKQFPTPLGAMLAGATREGICLLEFVNRRMLERELADLQQRLRASIVRGEHPFLTTLQHQLAEYFAGERTIFDVPLHIPGSEFQQRVWHSLMEIPYGEKRSYKAQAAMLGKPKAVRAVGRANGENRIAIVIPCHRVIGENGTLVGYGGGLDRKQWLLEHERNNASQSLIPDAGFTKGKRLRLGNTRR